MILFKLFFATIFASLLISYSSSANPVALIYYGPGSCEFEPQNDGSVRNEECSTVAAKIANDAGFEARFVKPEDIKKGMSPEQIQSVFASAVLWIQPGGHTGRFYRAVDDTFMESVKEFVRSGGGYVGWCAGGFAASFYETKKHQVESDLYKMAKIWNFLGAKSYIFESSLKVKKLSKNNRVKKVYYSEIDEETGEEKKMSYPYSSIETVTWGNKKRQVYFSGGASFFLLDKNQDFGSDKKLQVPEIISRYANGDIAAIRGSFGKGKVFVTGFHPEAPLWWSVGDSIKDSDGIDHDLVKEMYHWATKN